MENFKKRNRKPMDLIGKVFGRLTVISLYNQRSKQGKPQWLCKCNCGSDKDVIVTTNNLNAGNVKSCGCIRKNQKKSHYLPNGEASFNSLFSQYKRRAKNKNLLFTLTKDEFLILVKQECFYCSEPPRQKTNNPGFNGQFIYNGLDRIDNNVGYIIDNVVACCGKCNMMKNTSSKDEFLEHIRRILSNVEQ